MKNFLASSNPTQSEAQKLAKELDSVFSELDPMWLDFHDLCEARGWEI